MQWAASAEMPLLSGKARSTIARTIRPLATLREGMDWRKTCITATEYQGNQNFSSPLSIREVEEYHVDLRGITVLELTLVPSINGGTARASLMNLVCDKRSA